MRSSSSPQRSSNAWYALGGQLMEQTRRASHKKQERAVATVLFGACFAHEAGALID